MRRSIWIAAAVVLGAAAQVHARSEKLPEIKQKRSELKELKGRIKDLRQEVVEAEESRADVADQLKETERAISDASRRLRELAAQRSADQDDLATLETEAGALEQRVAAQRERLGRALRSRYESGMAQGPEGLVGGGDPNQGARDTHYLNQLSRAQAALIEELRLSLREKRELAPKLRTKTAQLAAIEASRRKEHADLLAQQSKRKQILERIAGDITVRRKEIASLERDEQRLGDLVRKLGRAVSQARKRAPARRTPSAAPAAGEPPPQSIARGEPTLDESDADGAFGRLKGRLQLPTRGELINRFGAPRLEGHSTWKGLYIKAAQGSEVKAVAAGRVVYADWLRGFGNLVIVDHGDSYLSVYGYNEALFKAEGNTVQAGETIATVGSSGGNLESGLYFELRHQGQPLNPMKWVTLR